MVLRWLRGLDSVQFHHTAFENTESCFEPFLIKIKFSLMVRCCSVGTHYKKFALASCSFHAGCEHREILRAPEPGARSNILPTANFTLFCWEDLYYSSAKYLMVRTIWLV